MARGLARQEMDKAHKHGQSTEPHTLENGGTMCPMAKASSSNPMVTSTTDTGSKDELTAMASLCKARKTESAPHLKVNGASGKSKAKDLRLGQMVQSIRAVTKTTKSTEMVLWN